MMRSLLYARTSPEARQGFAVFAAHLVFVIMVRERLWIVWTDVNAFQADWSSGKIANSSQ
jgi:hypothetical protein